MFKYQYFDVADFPIVVQRLQGPDPALVAAWLDEFRRLAAHYAGQRLCLVTECDPLMILRYSANDRKRLAELRQQHIVLLASMLVCEAYVVNSALGRGVMTAVRWVVPERWPTATFDSVEEARRWVGQQWNLETRRSA